MSKKVKKTTAQELPGLSLEQFEAAVNAIAKLRDDGKLLFFLGRRTRVKLIVEPDELHRALGEACERELTADDAKTALVEVTKYCDLWAAAENTRTAINYLKASVYSAPFEKLDTDAKKRFEEREESKLTLVSEVLFTDAISQRATRLDTATGPCLEEVDVELVQERRDDLRGRVVKDPFLRLRFRYSEGTGPDVFPWNLGLFMVGVQGTIGALPSFELECDETDIDLLILRLAAAKKLLPGSLDAPDTQQG